VFNDAVPAVSAAIDDAVARLQACGIAVERVHFSALEGIEGAMARGTFAGAEAYAWHAGFLAEGLGSQYDPRVLGRIEAGAAVDRDAYHRGIFGACCPI
jgi:aspartyl-tRNA(Asn)/glutamyl-tRNA(Gln) amidotransferase subunit A